MHPIEIVVSKLALCNLLFCTLCMVKLLQLGLILSSTVTLFTLHWTGTQSVPESVPNMASVYTKNVAIGTLTMDHYTKRGLDNFGTFYRDLFLP